MRTLILVVSLLAATHALADREQAREIPGYTYGASSLKSAPFSLDDLALLQQTMLLGEEDLEWLKKSKAVLEPHADEILDTWYGFVGANEHLLHYFTNAEGAPDSAYLERVRSRFRQWILDTADADYDQAWLDYQYEIGLRHHRIGKNKTDNATGPNHIPMRYVVALVYPVTATLKPFLERGDYSADEVNKMHQAWIKAVLLQTILWSYPYVNQGEF